MKSSTELLLGSGVVSRVLRLVGTFGAPRWHGVPTTRVPGTAAQQPANAQPGAAERSMRAQRLQGVGTAARLEPAAGRKDRRDPGAVDPDQAQQHPGHRTGTADGLDGVGRARLVTHRDSRPVHNPPPSLLAASRSLRSAASKSCLNSALDATAADGKARPINELPGGE